jgi:hypothetical protein
MQLSCNAATTFWDEFCATSAYLSNLTASSTLNGKTPYEAWTGCIPSLSYLCEIGCRAFALIQTTNPKIYHRLRPCILIGYAPHAKAYHTAYGILWTVASSTRFMSPSWNTLINNQWIFSLEQRSPLSQMLHPTGMLPHHPLPHPYQYHLIMLPTSHPSLTSYHHHLLGTPPGLSS